MTDTQATATVKLQAETSTEPLDVLLVLPHLGPGGAQKVAKGLAHHWAARGLRVGFLTTLASPPDAHRLGDEVTRLWLNEGQRRHDTGGSGEETSRSYWLGTVVRGTGFTALAAYAVAAETLLFVTSAYSKDYMGRLSRLSEWRVSALLILEQECSQIQSLSAARTVFASNASRLLVRVGAKLGIRRSMSKSERTEFEGVSPTEMDALSMLGGAQRQRIFAIRDVIVATRPSRVVAFLTQTNISTILATRGLDVSVIVSERNDPGRQRIAPNLERLREIVYPMADIVSANTQGAVDSLAKFVPSDRLRCVPNPIDVPEIDPSAKRDPRFICAARLVPQKGVDVAIEAFARIASKLPDWELHILGDGPLRSLLEEKIASLGLEHRVIMHGFVTDPIGHFVKASVFVLPSRFEGMPNALLEAMACELPAIVTNASPGPLEFIKHEETGLVINVDDVEGLAAAMLRMGSGELDREELALRAKVLLEHVAADRACSVWDEVVDLNSAENGKRAPDEKFRLA